MEKGTKVRIRDQRTGLQHEEGVVEDTRYEIDERVQQKRLAVLVNTPKGSVWTWASKVDVIN